MKAPRWELVLTIIINAINGALQLGLVPTGVWTKLAMWAITVLASVIAIVGKPLAGGQTDGSNKIGAFLLPFLIAGSLIGMAVAASGCATAGGKALGACELGQLTAVEQVGISDVTAIAMAGGANWEQELLDLGINLGPGQLNCIVKAIVAAWSASHAALSPERAAALVRLQTFLAKHPASACGPWIPTLVIPRS